MGVEQVHAFGLTAPEAQERLRRAALGPGVRAVLRERAAGLAVRIERREPGAAPAAARAAIEEALAPYAWGHGRDTLASAIGALLRARGRRLATAESCTGGWIARLITDVPGSSDYYLGGWVTYADDMKAELLGVPRALLAAHGAVSGPCALAMARGAAERSGADEALAVTGIAGPGGGSAVKPAGTVFIAAARRGGETSVQRFVFPGSRRQVRERSALTALQLLRWALLGAEPRPRLAWEVPLVP
jgi:nicotinamide-nucleotide amidase